MASIQVNGSIRLEKASEYYQVYFPRAYRMISNAPFNGGAGFSESYMNRHVPLDYNCDPVEETRAFLNSREKDVSRTTVSLTACSVEKGRHTLLEEDGYFAYIAITAGTANALSIGGNGIDGPGTVNIAVITDATLPDSAALNLYQGIIEAKAQAFNDSRVTDKHAGSRIAPGTSTDTVSLFIGNEGKEFEYGGRLTQVGRAISVAVYDSLSLIIKNPCH